MVKRANLIFLGNYIDVTYVTARYDLSSLFCTVPGAAGPPVLVSAGLIDEIPVLTEIRVPSGLRAMILSCRQPKNLA